MMHTMYLIRIKFMTSMMITNMICMELWSQTVLMILLELKDEK